MNICGEEIEIRILEHRHQCLLLTIDTQYQRLYTPAFWQDEGRLYAMMTDKMTPTMNPEKKHIIPLWCFLMISVVFPSSLVSILIFDKKASLAFCATIEGIINFLWFHLTSFVYVAFIFDVTRSFSK